MTSYRARLSYPFSLSPIGAEIATSVVVLSAPVCVSFMRFLRFLSASTMELSARSSLYLHTVRSSQLL